MNRLVFLCATDVFPCAKCLSTCQMIFSSSPVPLGSFFVPLPSPSLPFLCLALCESVEMTEAKIPSANEGDQINDQIVAPDRGESFLNSCWTLILWQLVDDFWPICERHSAECWQVFRRVMTGHARDANVRECRIRFTTANDEQH